MTDIKANLEIVQAKIANAAERAGRKASDITLIAVSKTQPIEAIAAAVESGVYDFGENRVQEALPKLEVLKAKYPHVKWHLIGHLQTNKVKQVVGKFDLIQSVDSGKLGREIENREQGTGNIMPILIEVNTSGEPSKFGVAPEQAIDLLQKLANMRNIKVQGLMTIGLFDPDPAKVRPCFIMLRKLSEQAAKLDLPNAEMKYLSMGMTDDFEIAIEEGSNMVRIGRAIFGKRSQ